MSAVADDAVERGTPGRLARSFIARSASLDATSMMMRAIAVRRLAGWDRLAMQVRKGSTCSLCSAWQ